MEFVVKMFFTFIISAILPAVFIIFLINKKNKKGLNGNSDKCIKENN